MGPAASNDRSARAGPNRRRTLGPFVLEEELGEGAAGVVYRARDTRVGIDIALKVIHPQLVFDQEVKERFKREILLGKRIDHPGVCRIFDLFELEDDKGPVIALAMELLDGQTLAEEIHAHGQLTPLRTLDVVEALAPALDAAHQAGVVHRDLKPGNVLVTTSGAIKLLDFGMATADDVSRVTRPGNTVGSLRFIAPEVWEGAPATPASDLYALGVLLYACLAGRLPYDASTPADMFQALKKPPRSIKALNPNVSDALAKVVERAMEPSPKRRYASGRELLLDMRRAVSRDGTRVIVPPRPFAPFWFWAVLLVVAVVSVAPIFWRRAPPPAPALEAPRRIVDWERIRTDRAVDFAAAEQPAAPPPNEDETVTSDDVVEDNDDDSVRTNKKSPGGKSGKARNAGLAALRESVLSARTKRGLLVGDVPDVDTLLADARRAEQAGNISDANQLLKKAAGKIERVRVDRAFVVAKQKRLTQRLDRASPKTRQRAQPLEADIARAFAARDYATANTVMNRAFALLR